MRNGFTALQLKERAIVAAFDELAVIRATGNTDTESLQTVLTALLTYPNSGKTKRLNPDHYNMIAGHCIQAADHLLRLCLLGQTPFLALSVIDEVLSIALGHIQTAIIKYTGPATLPPSNDQHND